VSVQAYKVTQSTKPADVVRRWYVVDAEDIVLGRLSTRVAMILRGKHRATFTPHVDTGDFVIVINAAKVKLTGRKLEQKTYYRHSGYTGNLKSTTAGKLLAGPHADRVVRTSIRGMLPKNALGRQMLTKLKVYAGPDHPHAAQKPEELTIG
jgi:large subunit ribosomal protein L13